MEGLGGRLRARARELGWSDAEVARRVGLGQTRYAGYVLDQHEPDLATLLRICATLGVSVGGLLGEIEGGPIGEAALRDRITAGMSALDPEALKALAIVTDGLYRPADFLTRAADWGCRRGLVCDCVVVHLVWRTSMSGRALVIRTDRSVDELRRLARREVDRAASARMYAIANALDGMSRAEAARLAGMERQALRDAVMRYNAEDLEGLHDRPRSGRKPRLTEAERTELSKLITDGPDVEASGLSAWTLADLCAEIKTRWDKTLHPASLSRVVRKLGFSRQKARQVHPQSDKEAQEAFKKGGFRRRSMQHAQPIPASA